MPTAAMHRLGRHPCQTLDIDRERVRPSESRIELMQVATGKIVDGKIVVDGAQLPEGAVVTVLSRGASEGFSLTPSEEDKLLEAIAEIERGDFVTLEDLVAS